VAVCLLVFYLALAFTFELYFVVHYRDIRQQTGFFARAYSIYGAGDQAYYGRGYVQVPLTLESINIFVTQIVNVALIWAIWKHRVFRHPLQLAVGSYMSYSVVFYFWLAFASHFDAMPHKTVWGYIIFFVPNLPWLLGYLYLAIQSFTAIVRALARQESQPYVPDTHRIPVGSTAQRRHQSRVSSAATHLPD
jgi:cholestenol Delta-isomerase